MSRAAWILLRKAVQVTVPCAGVPLGIAAHVAMAASPWPILRKAVEVAVACIAAILALRYTAEAAVRLPTLALVHATEVAVTLCAVLAAVHTAQITVPLGAALAAVHAAEIAVALGAISPLIDAAKAPMALIAALPAVHTAEVTVWGGPALTPVDATEVAVRLALSPLGEAVQVSVRLASRPLPETVEVLPFALARACLRDAVQAAVRRVGQSALPFCVKGPVGGATRLPLTPSIQRTVRLWTGPLGAVVQIAVAGATATICSWVFGVKGAVGDAALAILALPT